MKPKVQACLSQLIVSCQAYEDTPLYGAETMKKMVQSAMLGGAQAVRCCWPQDIRAARSLSEKLIIIGINKVMPKGEEKLDDVFITPTFEKAREVVEAGADILALATRITAKRGKTELLALLHEIHEAYPHIAVMADCATYEECRFCAESGCVDILSTTLSGLVNPIEGPDTELVRRLKQDFTLPVNAEGRIWELKDIDAVVEAGADMITIGTAITRPHLITERFLNHYRQQLAK